METSRRKILEGSQYDRLFPTAIGKTDTVLKNAGVDDTVKFIPDVVRDTAFHTAGLARMLKRATLDQTCGAIWDFVYRHIQYRKDADGYEQIRSPARTWRDRKSGVDCDCYSVFISSLLTNLGISHKLRITKYHRPYFQHIYPVVPLPNGGSIIIDCVTNKYNFEVPYSEKQDYSMDLQYLSGFEERGADIVFGDLGRARKKKATATIQPADQNAVPGSGASKKKKGFFKKLVSTVNKVNPATLLLRNGVLAAMKLNMFQVASRLKWSYISPNDAAKRKILPDKYQKLVAVRQKLENIFYGAGGKPDNLRKAILKGKGNKDKSVAVFGLGYLPSDAGIEFMGIDTPLPQLLGPDIWHSENVDGMEGFEGFGELGEPATGTAIAAATAAVAAIAKIIKSIGNIFQGNAKGSEDFSDATTAAADNEIATTPGSNGGNTALPAATDSQTVTSNSIVPSSNQLIADPDTTTVPGGFWQNNKKWLLPVGIGIGGITILALGMRMMGHHTTSTPPHQPKKKPADGLSGHTPRKRSKGKPRRKPASKKRGKAGKARKQDKLKYPVMIV